MNTALQKDYNITHSIKTLQPYNPTTLQHDTWLSTYSLWVVILLLQVQCDECAPVNKFISQ